MTLTDSIKKNTIEEKAEALYAYFDDLLARDLTLDGSVKSEEITSSAKQFAIKVCTEAIITCNQIGLNTGLHPAVGSKEKEWRQVRNALENIRG